MKAADLRKLSDAELRKRIQEEEQSLANLAFQKVISQLENPMKISQTKKDIARMWTILRERAKNAPKAESTTEPAKEST
ncbi:MAG TPA: 50S ribosomal protein L29 [Bacteroidota bacterium]|nr:50S ribosomal protein L29 [Bacteroidota bacterium]